MIEKSSFFVVENVVIDDEVIKQIFNSNIDLENTLWGVEPDFAIENTETGKILFDETKKTRWLG